MKRKSDIPSKIHGNKKPHLTAFVSIQRTIRCGNKKRNLIDPQTDRSTQTETEFKLSAFPMPIQLMHYKINQLTQQISVRGRRIFHPLRFGIT